MNNKTDISERGRIAQKLKEARRLAGLSQENAAKIIGVQRPAISEIESGKRKVSAEEIIQFSRLYKVSTSWLLHKEPETEMDEKLKIAARELSKMSDTDRRKLLDILKILPK